MYYLIPGISFFAGFTISHIFSITMENHIWTNLLKLTGILLIISFLIISVQCIMTFHNEKNDEAFNFGSRINEWTKPGDYICIINLINPITYYADRPNIQNPTNEPAFSKIRAIKPKIVVFPYQESMDSTWSRQDLIKVLQEENYHLLTIRPSFEIWIRSITIPEILVRDVDSIDVRDTRTGDLIPDVDTREYVSQHIVINNQLALYEHPVLNGTIRTNYFIDIPEGSLLTFGIGLDEKTWDPNKGDGVQFEIFCQSGSNETRIFSQYTDPKNNPADRKWQNYSIPFDTCIGNNTKVSFATSSGPKNDNSDDWAYWINPRIKVNPVKFRIQNISSIEIKNFRTEDMIPDVDTRKYVSQYGIIDKQPALFEHPLLNSTIRTDYILDIPKDSFLIFGIGLDERTWDPNKGDGVQFEVFCQSGSNEVRLFSQYTDPKNNPEDRKWHYYSIPFDTCIGNNTKVSFATSPGPKNDNSDDWAYWINPRIEVKPEI